jgi:hypothetical protein
MCAVVLSLLCVTEGHSSIPSAPREVKTTAASLQSIASWLERAGEHGWMGADVADALEILRLRTEQSVAARQKAYRSGETLHLAQVSADDRREFLLFMVKGPDEQVYFYLSTVAEGFKKAFVVTPGAQGVFPLHPEVAARGFQAEVAYWEGIVATR